MREEIWLITRPILFSHSFGPSQGTFNRRGGASKCKHATEEKRATGAFPVCAFLAWSFGVVGVNCRIIWIGCLFPVSGHLLIVGARSNCHVMEEKSQSALSAFIWLSSKWINSTIEHSVPYSPFLFARTSVFRHGSNCWFMNFLSCPSFLQDGLSWHLPFRQNALTKRRLNGKKWRQKDRNKKDILKCPDRAFSKLRYAFHVWWYYTKHSQCISISTKIARPRGES